MQGFILKESKQWPVICFEREEFSFLKQAVDPAAPIATPRAGCCVWAGWVSRDHHSSSPLTGHAAASSWGPRD